MRSGVGNACSASAKMCACDLRFCRARVKSVRQPAQICSVAAVEVTLARTRFCKSEGRVAISMSGFCVRPQRLHKSADGLIVAGAFMVTSDMLGRCKESGAVVSIPNKYQISDLRSQIAGGVDERLDLRSEI